MKTQATSTIDTTANYTSTIALMKTGYYNSDMELVKSVKAGDYTADKFYTIHRAEFLKWAFKYFSLTADQALDLYHDTFIILYENVKKGKLHSLQSSLKTYVFAIGKNLILQQFNKEKKFKQAWENLSDELGIADESIDDLCLLQEAILKCLDQLPEPNRSLLKAYYFNKLSMKAIAEKLGYKNEDVAKNVKARCMKLLKKAVLASLN